MQTFINVVELEETKWVVEIFIVTPGLNEGHRESQIVNGRSIFFRWDHSTVEILFFLSF